MNQEATSGKSVARTGEIGESEREVTHLWHLALHALSSSLPLANYYLSQLCTVAGFDEAGARKPTQPSDKRNGGVGETKNDAPSQSDRPELPGLHLPTNGIYCPQCFVFLVPGLSSSNFHFGSGPGSSKKADLLLKCNACSSVLTMCSVPKGSLAREKLSRAPVLLPTPLFSAPARLQPTTSKPRPQSQTSAALVPQPILKKAPGKAGGNQLRQALAQSSASRTKMPGKQTGIASTSKPAQSPTPKSAKSKSALQKFLGEIL